MKILIITFGSRGDVQPYVALGKGLKAAGHVVTLCTASTFETFVTNNGLNYGYMTDELIKLMDSEAGKDALEDTVGLWGTAKTMFKLVKATMPLNRQMIIDSWEAAKVAAPELVIYHPKALGGLSIADAFNAPAILAVLQPMMLPTAEFPTIGVPALPLGGWYNKLTYKLIAMGYGQYTKTVNEIRQGLMGLDKLPKSTGVLTKGDGSPIPVMHGFSQHVIPRPKDWPDQAAITGYWFLDQQNDWEPPAELKAFLGAGEPPVYVGFGSMAGKKPQRLANIVVEALQKANVRGIIAAGWGGLDTGDLPDSIFKIDKAPHDWLFPRMAAVVHHGGAGTTAAGLRAGRPSLICSFMGDQPFWGERVYQLGVGPKFIPQKKLSVDKLADALHTLTTDAKMRTKAAEIGVQISGEDGIANAIAIINDVLQQTNLTRQKMTHKQIGF